MQIASQDRQAQVGKIKVDMVIMVDGMSKLKLEKPRSQALQSCTKGPEVPAIRSAMEGSSVGPEIPARAPPQKGPSQKIDVDALREFGEALNQDRLAAYSKEWRNKRKEERAAQKAAQKMVDTKKWWSSQPSQHAIESIKMFKGVNALCLEVTGQQSKRLGIPTRY